MLSGPMSATKVRYYIDRLKKRANDSHVAVRNSNTKRHSMYIWKSIQFWLNEYVTIAQVYTQFRILHNSHKRRNAHNCKI